MSPESYIDIAYLGMDNDLDKIIELNTDTEYLVYVEGATNYRLLTATGEKINFDGSKPEVKPEEKPEEEVVYIAREKNDRVKVVSVRKAA